MFQRSLIASIAALGGILVILGGVLIILLSSQSGGFGVRDYTVGGALIYGSMAIILGLVILVFSGFTHYRGVERNMTGGLILLILGAVTWIIIGGGVLVAVGCFLVVLAGILLMVEVVVSSPNARSSPTP